jgi:hypothetical protein
MNDNDPYFHLRKEEDYEKLYEVLSGKKSLKRLRLFFEEIVPEKCQNWLKLLTTINIETLVIFACKDIGDISDIFEVPGVSYLILINSGKSWVGQPIRPYELGRYSITKYPSLEILNSIDKIAIDFSNPDMYRFILDNFKGKIIIDNIENMEIPSFECRLESYRHTQTLDSTTHDRIFSSSFRTRELKLTNVVLTKPIRELPSGMFDIRIYCSRSIDYYVFESLLKLLSKTEMYDVHLKIGEIIMENDKNRNDVISLIIEYLASPRAAGTFSIKIESNELSPEEQERIVASLKHNTRVRNLIFGKHVSDEVLDTLSEVLDTNCTLASYNDITFKRGCPLTTIFGESDSGSTMEELKSKECFNERDIKTLAIHRKMNRHYNNKWKLSPLRFLVYRSLKKRKMETPYLPHIENEIERYMLNR